MSAVLFRFIFSYKSNPNRSLSFFKFAAHVVTHPRHEFSEKKNIRYIGYNQKPCAVLFSRFCSAFFVAVKACWIVPQRAGIWQLFMPSLSYLTLKYKTNVPLTIFAPLLLLGFFDQIDNLIYVECVFSWISPHVYVVCVCTHTWMRPCIGCLYCNKWLDSPTQNTIQRRRVEHAI